jgi:hypothetical protein
MTESQEQSAAQSVIGHVHSLLCDMDGVLIDDYHASTTAIIWLALEMQLGGSHGVERLVMSREP